VIVSRKLAEFLDLVFLLVRDGYARLVRGTSSLA